MLKKLLFLMFPIFSIGQNCTSVFWTINTNGDIREWEFNENVISGGNVIATNEFFPTGISYCGTGDDTTFYCTNTDGLAKYDTNIGWINVINNIEGVNNGGYANHHYYMNEETLKYFNGTSTSTVAYLANGLAVADIAVDSLGRAWVFVGNDGAPIMTTSLRVYNSSGLIASYPISFNSTATYGAMFFNDVLYIAKTTGQFAVNENTLTPVTINGSNAQLGTPIPFNCIGCQDVASCNVNQLSVNDNTITDAILSPNPTSDFVNISSKIQVKNLKVFSNDGRLIKVTNENFIDLSNFSQGVYLVSITTTSNDVYTKLIVKK